MLEAGSKAPDFTLKDQNGKTVTLSDFSGKTVVLYFYPKANTSGCKTQAEGVRDHKADYANAGATVIGVSPDEVKAVKKFDDNNGFGFTLLADKDHKVSEMYGTWVEKSMYGN
ncbi:peroxiredoxin, partial [Pseudanabaena sp. CCNP1317]|uniref:peroxiredoxin n=1 Tax=Pseudanabaena sp. CCNP1317 TaxID=3110253 RepID=UPI002B20070E